MAPLSHAKHLNEAVRTSQWHDAFMYYSSLGPTLLTTYCLTLFCSSPPTPSMTSATSPSAFGCPSASRLPLTLRTCHQQAWVAPSPLRDPRLFPTGLACPILLVTTTQRIEPTRSRSAPASINNTAAAPCPDSIARCSGVLPARSGPFRRVGFRPGGGCRRRERKASEPVVAARWRGYCDALSLTLIYI